MLQLLCKVPSCQVHLVALVQLQVRLELLLLVGPQRKLQAQPARSLWQCRADCAQRMLSWQLCLLCSAAGLLMLRRLPLCMHPLRTALPSRLWLACGVDVIPAAKCLLKHRTITLTVMVKLLGRDILTFKCDKSNKSSSPEDPLMASWSVECTWQHLAAMRAQRL